MAAESNRTKIFRYRDWVLEVEPKTTEVFYKKVSKGFAEMCGCGDCKYFLSIKNNLYTNDIRDLLLKLGIDINKEIDVAEFGFEGPEYVYNWRFHFVGDIIEGNDCSVPLINGGYTLDLFSINDAVSIGFTEVLGRVKFETEKKLIEINLMAKLPKKTE